MIFIIIYKYNELKKIVFTEISSERNTLAIINFFFVKFK